MLRDGATFFNTIPGWRYVTLSHSLTPSQLELHDAVAFFYAIRDWRYVTLSHSLTLFRPTPHDAATFFNTITEFSNTHSPCNLNFLVVLQIKVNSQVNCEDEMLFNVKANGTHIYHCNGEVNQILLLCNWGHVCVETADAHLANTVTIR